MRPKGQLKFFRPTNLKRGQISEICLKKGQSANPAQKPQFSWFPCHEYFSMTCNGT